MSKPTLKGFLEFCKGKEGTINNEYWSTCAVGSYLYSLGIELEEYTKEPHLLVDEEHSECVKAFIDELKETWLYSRLEYGAYYTYEELNEAIDTNV